MSEVTETSYYTVEFQSNFGADLWIFAANDRHSNELTREEAQKIADRCQSLGLGVRVHLHTKRETKQLVMAKAAP